MGYTNVALENKITEMYPEIERHGITVNVAFIKEQNTFLVKFRKDAHELTTHLDKKDADECMDGMKCVYLGVQIGEFVRNFEGASQG